MPLPQSADDHQEFNAAYMARFGGAVIVNQDHPEEKVLKNIMSNLISSNSLIKMKSNMNNYDFKNPVKNILKIINTLKEYIN